MRVRLTHALGASEYELHARSIDDPVLIGRSAEADLQVPSIDIAATHAVMFAHGGVWVVQDSGTASGTHVNGVRTDGPTPVNIGDTISLGTGPKAATVQVLALDEPSTSAAPMPTEPEIGALEASVASVPYARRYPKKNQSNSVAVAGIAGAVLIGIGFVAAIWAYIAYHQKVRANEELARQNAALKPEVIVKKSESQHKTIFMDGSKAVVSSAAAQVPTPVAPPSVTPPAQPEEVKPAPLPTETHTPAAPDGVESPEDAAWARVLEFRDSSPPALAIYQYLLYRDTKPDAEKLKKLDTMQDDAIDLLWWQRVNDLVGQQTQITGQIADLKKEKASLPSDATKERREQFDKQIKHLESLRASNTLLLRDEMGYQGDAPVDFADDARLKSLREKRNTDAYQRWTARVISRVKATRGASAW
jgi:hypothetical protein